MSGYGPADQFTYAYDGSIEVPMGSLMFHDTNDAKPALSAADAGTYAQNKAAFAPLFAGVAVEAKAATSPAGTIQVAADGVYEFDCTSDTFEVGDFVAPADVGPGVGLNNTVLTKTSTANERIGYVVKREASAVTRVRVRLISRVTPNFFALA
jgi:p-aminobenzoyl-glutamate transporter AbgT